MNTPLTTTTTETETPQPALSVVLAAPIVELDALLAALADPDPGTVAWGDAVRARYQRLSAMLSPIFWVDPAQPHSHEDLGVSAEPGELAKITGMSIADAARNSLSELKVLRALLTNPQVATAAEAIVWGYAARVRYLRAVRLLDALFAPERVEARKARRHERDSDALRREFLAILVWPDSRASTGEPDEPSVGLHDESIVVGRRMRHSLNDFVRAVEVHLLEEQRRPSPDNALLAVLCDAVRLAREHADRATRFLAPAPAPANPRITGYMQGPAANRPVAPSVPAGFRFVETDTGEGFVSVIDATTGLRSWHSFGIVYPRDKEGGPLRFVTVGRRSSEAVNHAYARTRDCVYEAVCCGNELTQFLSAPLGYESLATWAEEWPPTQRPPSVPWTPCADPRPTRERRSPAVVDPTAAFTDEATKP